VKQAMLVMKTYKSEEECFWEFSKVGVTILKYLINVLKGFQNVHG
jgi:hypothetical protein